MNTDRIAGDLIADKYKAQAAADAAHAKQNADIFGGIANAAGGVLAKVGLQKLLAPGADPTVAGGGDVAIEGAPISAADTLGSAAPEATEVGEVAAESTAFAGQRPGQGAGTGYKLRQYSDGGKVDGHAAVPGDSPKNDTVTAKLSPGEIVIPRSKVGSPDAAHRFLEAVMDKKKKKVGGFGGVLQAKRELEELKARMADLKKHIGGAK